MKQEWASRTVWLVKGYFSLDDASLSMSSAGSQPWYSVGCRSPRLMEIYKRLEPYAGKLARTVLRGVRRSNASCLPDWHFRQGELVVVIDWKSGREVPETVEKDLQLQTYAWGLKQAIYPDAREILVRLHFLRYGKEREVFWEPRDLEKVPLILDEKISWIKGDKNFDPTPGGFCGWCGVTSHCPVITEGLTDPAIMAPESPDQAEKAVALLLTLKQMEKQMAERIKNWVKGNGPIKIGDLVYGPREVTTYCLDPQTVTQKLLEAGLQRQEIWPLLSVSKTDLKRGLQKACRKDLLESILSSGILKKSERIDFWKAKRQ